MRTYVQCPYCMGYNTHRIPVMRTLDGRIETFPPECFIRFSGIDCKPKEWSPIVGEDYKFMGFCNYCQVKFVIRKENLNNTLYSCMSVVVGRIESGFILIGDKVTISSGIEQIEATVCGIEMFGKNLPTAEFGDNVGILLDVDKGAIHQGDILKKHIIL